MKDVRKGFSKSLIALADGSLSMRYFSTEENKWATQCFGNDDGDNSKAVFETLLSNSDALSITVSLKNGVVFDFITEQKSGTPEVYLYYPSAHDLTQREYEELLAKDRGYSQDCVEIAERFVDEDIEDEETVFDFISELISSRQEGTEDIIDFGGLSRWGYLYPAVTEFAEDFGFGILSAEPPAPSGEGFVTLSTAVDDGHRFWNFSEESKDSLLEILSAATAFDIECGSSGGEEILNITLYA